MTIFKVSPMPNKYKIAVWKESFADDIIGKERSDDPPLEEMVSFFKSLEITV